MLSKFRALFVFVALVVLTGAASAQIDQICGESGGSAWLNERVVYGKVTVSGLASGARFPKITVILNVRGRDVASHTVETSGFYCFRDVEGSDGQVTVEVEGVEVGRQILPTADLNLIRQFRQDFDIMVPSPGRSNRPGTISVQYPRTDENAKVFEQASKAAEAGKTDDGIKLFRTVVEADPGDFVAWTQLGGLYFEKKQYPNAVKAYKAAMESKADFAPAMVNLGRIYLMEGNLEAAVEVLKRATDANPAVARAHQLLGEAYLLSKKGTLGVEALNEAIRLEPVAMAESHLLLATLYDRAGAKFMATREYKQFLEKVPDHKDAKKFRRYIEENPEREQ